MNKNKSVLLILFITMMFLFMMGMLIFSCIDSFNNNNGGFNTMIYYIYP
jgi:hypothetical protein